MKLYEKNFTFDQLKEILSNSNTYDEALEKLGYIKNNANRKVIREISQNYNISIDHFINGQTSNLIGQRFGRLIVEKKVPSRSNRARWLCKCDCGQYKEVDGNHLKRNEILSCGCYHKEIVANYNTNQKLVDLTNQKFN